MRSTYFARKYQECFNRLVEALESNEQEVAWELSVMCAELKAMAEKARKLEELRWLALSLRT